MTTVPAPYQRVFTPYTGNPFTYGYNGEHQYFPGYDAGNLLAGFTPEPNPVPGQNNSGGSTTAAGVALSAPMVLGLANQGSKLLTGESLLSHGKSAAQWAAEQLGLGGAPAAASAADIAAANAVMGPAIEAGGWEAGLLGGAEPFTAWEGAGGAGEGVTDAIASLFGGGGEAALGTSFGIDAAAMPAGMLGELGGTAAAASAPSWGIASAIPAVGMAGLAAFIASQELRNPDIPEEHVQMSYDPSSRETSFRNYTLEGGDQASADSMQAQWQQRMAEADPNFDFYAGNASPLDVTIFRKLGQYYPEVSGGGTAYAQNNGLNGLAYMGGINPQGQLGEYSDRFGYSSFDEALNAALAWINNPNQTDYSYMRLAQERQDSR